MKKNNLIQFIKTPLLLLPILLLMISCGDDTSEDMEQMMEIEKNECTPYTTSTLKKTITGTWTEANERIRYTDEIVIPADPGGGYVTVKVTHSDPDLRAALIVDQDFIGAAIISGSAATTNNEQVREASFSVHPGIKYTLEVYPFFNSDSYPVDYTLEWEFFSKMDCWEPNDVVTDGKKVLFDELVEAYAISGHIDDGVGAFDDHTYDWYKVELDTPSILNVEILDLPKDLRIGTRWFSEDASINYASNFEYTGSDFGLSFNRGMTSANPTTQVLDPGTYYIEVHADFLLNGRKASSDLDPIPEHFNKTYTLKVSKQ